MKKAIVTIMSAKDIMKEFNITHKQLTYLFEKGRLDEEEFPFVNGRRMYKSSDFSKIRKALEQVKRKKGQPIDGTTTN